MGQGERREERLRHSSARVEERSGQILEEVDVSPSPIIPPLLDPPPSSCPCGLA